MSDQEPVLLTLEPMTKEQAAQQARNYLAQMRNMLRGVRQAEEDAKDRLTKYRMAHRDPLLEELEQNLKEAKNRTAEAEAGFRTEALYFFSSIEADKKPVEGIEIKFEKELDYEYDGALAWATVHEVCLALDVKAFETLAKMAIDSRHLAMAMDLTFVDAVDVPKAYISSKLPEPKPIEGEAMRPSEVLPF